MERGPPVAATTEVIRTVSRRQISQATGPVLAKGGHRSSAPEESPTASSARASSGVLRSGMSEAGRKGAPTNTTAPAPSRTQAKVWSSRFRSSEGALLAVTNGVPLLDQRDDLE